MSKACNICGGLVIASNETMGYGGPICPGHAQATVIVQPVQSSSENIASRKASQGFKEELIFRLKILMWGTGPGAELDPGVALEVHQAALDILHALSNRIPKEQKPLKVDRSKPESWTERQNDLRNMHISGYNDCLTDVKASLGIE